MMDIRVDEILQYGREKFPSIEMAYLKPSELIFEERVKMSCFYCARYGVSWKCPPRLPPIDYPKMMEEFDNGAFVWLDMPVTEQNYADIRTESSVILHRALLHMEKYLLQRGAPIYLSFIGGSCKLCKNGCGKERCNNPYKARTPLEATGVNVVKSAEKADIDISFPATKHITRIGLLLW
mgnify:CR=1 FL=1|jgi:hypothetical protein